MLKIVDWVEGEAMNQSEGTNDLSVLGKKKV
jgi:hypothetical protein